LIYALILPKSIPFRLIDFRSDGDGESGQFIMVSPEKGDMWFVSAGTETLLWGVLPSRLRMTTRKERSNECNMYTTVEKDYPLLFPRLPKRYERSLGISFASVSKSGTSAWKDITGKDSGCTEITHFVPKDPLLGSVSHARKYLHEQLSIPETSREALDDILQQHPLSKSHVKVMSPKASWAWAKSHAESIGYPRA
jgi:hypothetical protein